MDQSANLLSTPELSPLEQDVLDEYERLAENMKKVMQQPPWPQKIAPRSRTQRSGHRFQEGTRKG